MRFLFAVLMAAHGLIHLLGAAKGLGLAEIPQLSQPISRGWGMLWLVAAIVMAVAAGMFGIGRPGWWLVAAAAIVLSQVLIGGHWADARFGTVANLMIAIVGVVGFGTWRFDRMVAREMASVQSLGTTDRAALVTQGDLAALPDIVRRWLLRSGVVGKPRARSIHLTQQGEMKTTPDGKWVPFSAEQRFRVDPPGFVWRTRLRVAPLIDLVGRDKYQDGRGRMTITLLGLFRVAEGVGAEADQGTLVRFMAETCWFPSAALEPYLRWDGIDSLAAKVTMNYGGTTGSGIFRFNPDGDPTSFEAKRYYSRKTGATLEDWLVTMTDWREVGGVRIPMRSEVAWKLAGGDFTWLRLGIVAIDRTAAEATQ